MKRVLKWIGIALATALAFIITLVVGRKEGEGEGKIEAETQATVDKIEAARKSGDTDAIDDIWRGGGR